MQASMQAASKHQFTDHSDHRPHSQQTPPPRIEDAAAHCAVVSVVRIAARKAILSTASKDARRQQVIKGIHQQQPRNWTNTFLDQKVQ